jgi:predicted phosphodiesterase
VTGLPTPIPATTGTIDMASANPIGKELILRSLKRFPDVPSTTLARKLVKENPEVWMTEDSCRAAIRYYRGAVGEKHSRQLSIQEFRRPKQTNHDPTKLPLSEERSYTPFEIEGIKRLGVLSDIHIPYHSLPALKEALRHLKSRKVDGILLNGDTIDFYQLSRFEKDPRERSAAEEIKATKQFLDYLREQFPKARLIWKDGNHDERYQAYLRAKAPELLDVPEFRFPDLMQFAARGVEYVTDKRLITAGHLSILHGHEYRQAILAPVNAARGFFLKAKDSTLTGHLHQSSEHTEPTVTGRMITCFSAGCLCDLHPAYMPLNRWNHGFSVVALGAQGTFEVENRRIFNGKLL